MTKENQELLGKITKYINLNEEIQFLGLIGSNSNIENINDEYSDIDLIFVTNNSINYFNNSDWLSYIDEVWFSFTEADPGINHWERRCIFKNGLDVDFIIVDGDQLKDGVASFPVLNEICLDSLQVIVDKNNIRPFFNRFINNKTAYKGPSRSEFENIVNDFYFHYLWCYKKCLRGEYWVALQCVNGYLKNKTLKMIEWYEHSVNGVDYNTYYQGRYIEKWAENSIKIDMNKIYSNYSKENIISALNENIRMFTKIADLTGSMNGYDVPKKEIDKLINWVNTNYTNK